MARPNRRSQPEQLDLLRPPARPLDWLQLPVEARATVTRLMAQLLSSHADPAHADRGEGVRDDA